MNVLDIVRMTPKTNCGQCGYPACMAFAVAVSSGRASLDACPYISCRASDVEAGSAACSVSDSDTVLLKTLKSKVSSIDMARRAGRLGGVMVEENGKSVLQLMYLVDIVHIAADGIVFPSGKALDPRDQILLYNYLFFGGRGTLSGNWVGLESFPNSISKVVTLKRYTEEKIAREFKGRVRELRAALLEVNALEIDDCHADLCLMVSVLPMVPLRVHFWDADEEDGFAAGVKILFDSNALEFLDIESLIFAAERMTEKILGQC